MDKNTKNDHKMEIFHHLWYTMIFFKKLNEVIPNILYHNFFDPHLRDSIGLCHVVTAPENSVTDWFA